MADLTSFQIQNGGVGAGQFMDGSGFSAAGKSIPPPNTASPIPSSQITGGNNLNLPPTIPPNNGTNLVAGIIGSQSTAPIAPPTSSTPSTDQATNLAATGDYTQDPQYQAALQQYKSSVDQFGQTINQAPSQADLLGKAQVSSGANDKLATLNNLNTQLANSNAQFMTAGQNVETQGIQQGTPSVFYQGEQAAIQRQQAVVSGALAAQVQAAQGNYDAAEKIAEQTASLQFSDFQNKIDNMQKFIALNQSNLTNAEKLAVSKMQAQSVFLQQQLDQQKTLRTLALQMGVTKPFMNIGGTVYRTSDGKAFASPQEASAAGVDVKKWSNVQTVDPTKTSQKFQQIGVDDFGNPTYGFVNDIKNTITPIVPTTGDYTATGNNLVSTKPDPSKVINGYDFTSYATDPNWGNKVNSILKNIPQGLPNGATGPASPQEQAQSLDSYIKKVAPNSPVTGDMIMQVAKQYGVDARTLTAIMMEESRLGTDGSKGAKGNNFGNVGNNDTLMANGGSSDFKTPLEGIQAVAQNMSQRVSNPPQTAQLATSQKNFAQYGLLAKTNFNPNNTIDKLSQLYLDKYIKSGAVPTASTLGRAIKPQAMAQIDSRARDLYYQATGTAMPNPEIIKGYQDLIISNNKIANNLKIQEQTVAANVDLSLQNMKKNNLNSSNFKPLNNLINNIDNLFNDPATGQLIAQNSTIQNELGSLLAVKNATGTTVFDKMTSAGIISKNDNQAQVTAKVNALLQEAANFSTSIKAANADAYKFTDPFIQDPNNPIIALSKQKGFNYIGALAEGHSYDDIINFLQQQ